jgi:very-short-patch-repair endonuclease
MPQKNIATKQRVHPEMQKRAVSMRREMTPAEKKLWQRLRANRLEDFHFRRQQVIGPYIADFYCHAADLVVEVDGPIHQSRQAYDQKRDAYLADRGLMVLRFTNLQVEREMDAVLAEILQVCRSRRL